MEKEDGKELLKAVGMEVAELGMLVSTAMLLATPEEREVLNKIAGKLLEIFGILGPKLGLGPDSKYTKLLAKAVKE